MTTSFSITPVILSGGMGARLWPLSRKLLPKQFLKLTSERSLIQDTLLRVSDRQRFSAPIIVGSDVHRFLLAEQLLELDITPERLIVEPEARNTAFACALAATYLVNEIQAERPMLVLAADHAIRKPAPLLAAFEAALPLAQSGRLVTFGITPDYAETGYGYIEQGAALSDSVSAFDIARFVEKPSAERAREMLKTGRFSWNSGMFMFRPDTFLAELRRFEPGIADAAAAALAKASQDPDFLRPDREAVLSSPSRSVDHAVMEHTDKGAVIPLDCGWSDVGSFHSLWETLDKDAAGNVAVGDTVLADTRNSYIHAEAGLVATIGLDDTVVVTTTDAVLVAHRDKVQDIKALVDHLRQVGRAEGESHKRVHRPWGYYQSIDSGARYQVKQLMVQPGAKISLQKHHHRAEHWIVVEGTAKVTCGDDVRVLQENQSTYIPIGVVHRLENPGTGPLRIIEVQSGSYLGEDDIVRYEDSYGRQSND